MAEGKGDSIQDSGQSSNGKAPAIENKDFAEHKNLFVVKADSVTGGDPKVQQLMNGFQIVDENKKPLTENPQAPVHCKWQMVT